MQVCKPSHIVKPYTKHCSTVATALKTLLLLGAMDSQKAVTRLGHIMVLFPLEPHLARSLLASHEHGCTLEVLDIISVLSSASKLFIDMSERREATLEARKKFEHSSGDHLTILNVIHSYQEIERVEKKTRCKMWCQKHFLNEHTLLEATRIRNQLRLICNKVGIDWQLSCGDNEEPVLKSLLTGLVQNSALLQPDGLYKQTMGHAVCCLSLLQCKILITLQVIRVHPGSILSDKKAPVIFYDELVSCLSLS